MDTDVKRPVWLKQMPRALNIPESNPHPTPSSPPRCLTHSAQTASNPSCDEEIILSKRSEPFPALAHTHRCVCVPVGLLQAHPSHADPVSPAANWRETPKVSTALSRHPHPETLEVLEMAPSLRMCLHRTCTARSPHLEQLLGDAPLHGRDGTGGMNGTSAPSPCLPEGTPRHAQQCAPPDGCLLRRH